MPPLSRSLPVLIVLVLLLGVAACSNGDEAPATSTAPSAATARSTSTAAEPMNIVTPTPIPAGATVAPVGTGEPAQNPETYVVQPNDTLYGIAIRFGVDLNQLIELNGLSDPNDIQVGQELKIPQR
jgi:lipoprotein NlpD